MTEDQEYERVINVTSRVPAAGFFIAHDEYPIAAIITEMRLAMDERPIWTRRSMWNRLGAKFAELPKNGGLVRHCLQYAGYQFKGGPWRDALVRYGLDPRTDPRYRVYQTLIFKLHKTRIGSVGRSWQAVRRKEIGVSNFGKAWQDLAGKDEASLRTHVFNGESFSTDGKVWQVCDITDPLLAQLFADAEVREECDVEVSGYYHRVLWSVAKAIMKCKMVAIRFNRTVTDEDFSGALDVARNEASSDGVALGSGNNSIGISLPDLGLTPEEYDELRAASSARGRGLSRRGGEVEGKKKRTHYRVRIPLKEAEDREAVKMIKLLTQGTAAKKAAEDAAAAEGEAARDEAAGGKGKAVQRVGGAGEQEEQEEEGEQRDGGAFQEILEDMEEEGSEDEEDMEGRESDMEEDEEGIPGRHMLSFQGRQPEVEVEQEEEEEEEEEDDDDYRRYSEEEDEQEDEEDEEEEEGEAEDGDEDGEGGFGVAEDGEDEFGEEDEYYDEEAGEFPRPWEQGNGYGGGQQYGNSYYE
ncbi:tau 95 subunit of transcription factor TFIIIC [Collariella sp. IMI 366227]|nr:tau 95 subunit of transcription factor TFIIIC [Collariella sp. IMI 366227]